jgi:mannose-6-phosphate isomerase-like protein (cupin superfamily)
MKKEAINLYEKFSKFSDKWKPKIIARMNDYHIKLVRVEGDFTWHNHKETDELFLVIDGDLKIDFRERSVTLNEGEMFVIPKGVEHKPYAERECKILLIEPAGTINTGDAGGSQTAEDNVWI